MERIVEQLVALRDPPEIHDSNPLAQMPHPPRGRER